MQITLAKMNSISPHNKVMNVFFRWICIMSGVISNVVKLDQDTAFHHAKLRIIVLDNCEDWYYKQSKWYAFILKYNSHYVYPRQSMINTLEWTRGSLDHWLECRPGLKLCASHGWYHNEYLAFNSSSLPVCWLPIPTFQETPTFCTLPCMTYDDPLWRVPSMFYEDSI